MSDFNICGFIQNRIHYKLKSICIPVHKLVVENVSLKNTELIAGDVIKKTSAEALKPSVVNITGPLIRILGDRFSFNVKVAVLETLGLLLGKVVHLANSQLIPMNFFSDCNYSEKIFVSLVVMSVLPDIITGPDKTQC